MSMLPCQVKGGVTTPFKLFYQQKPDLRVLFPFGCLGHYHRPVDGSTTRTAFASKTSVGIALGRSDHSNSMLFYNPILGRFSVSADFKLDTTNSIRTAFPDQICDGALHMQCFTNAKNAPAEFPLHGPVIVVRDDQMMEGTIDGLPSR